MSPRHKEHEEHLELLFSPPQACKYRKGKAAFGLDFMKAVEIGSSSEAAKTVSLSLGNNMPAPLQGP